MQQRIDEANYKIKEGEFEKAKIIFSELLDINPENPDYISGFYIASYWDNRLEKILSIRGVTYVRKDLEYKERMMGVIAQEILPYIPEVVHQNVDGRYSVAYSNMIAVLIEAIKDLNKKIENLEEQLENLL